MSFLEIAVAATAVIIALYFWIVALEKKKLRTLVLVEQPERGVKKPAHIPFEDPLVGNFKMMKAIALLAQRKYKFVENSLSVLTEDCGGSVELEMNQGMFLHLHSVNVWNVEVAKDILNDKNGVFHKLDLGAVSNLLISESVLNVQGERWRKQRAILSPAFRIQHLRALLPAIYEVGRDLLGQWKDLESQPVLLSDWMHRTTLEIIGLTGFGHSFGALRDAAHHSDNMKNYQALMKELFNIVHLVAPPVAKITGRTKILTDLVNKFETWMVELIQEKRDKLQKEQEEGVETERDATDILEVMVRAHDGENGSLTDRELIHNMNTFFIAGHETTAGAIVNTLHLLAANPEIQTRVALEIRLQAPDGDASSDQIKSMELLEASLKESMRLFPPVFMVSRQASEDTVLNGYHIAKGTLLGVQTYIIHRNPKYWPEPDRFNPDRFLDGTSRETFLFLPFSKGSRMCIGVNFAMLEMKALLSQLLVKYEFYYDPSDSPFRVHLGSVLTADPSCTIRFRPRVF